MTKKTQGRDLTTGAIPRLVAVLSAPGAAEVALYSVSGLVHAYWMGRVGGVALAALSISMTLNFLFICPLIGVSTGVMAVVARHIGAGEQEQADRATLQGILFFLGVGLSLTALGQLGAPLFLRWMGATGELHASAVSYARLLIAGLVLAELPFTTGAAMRGAGHPEFSFYTGLTYVLVSILFETAWGLGLLPFGPLTLNGAGVAHLVGAAACWGVLVYALASGRGGVRLRRRDLRPDRSYLSRMARIAGPTAVQRLSPSLANALLMRLVASFGTSMITAYALVGRISFFVTSFGIGIANAAGAMVGQNLGAKKPDRAASAVRWAGILTVAICVVLGGLLNMMPRPIVDLFSPTPEVMALAVKALLVSLLTTTTMSLYGVFSNALLAAGDAVAVMVISVATLWGGQLCLAWLLSTPMGMGPIGVWLGVAGGCTISLVVFWIRWRQGIWREKTV